MLVSFLFVNLQFFSYFWAWTVEPSLNTFSKLNSIFSKYICKLNSTILKEICHIIVHFLNKFVFLNCTFAKYISNWILHYMNTCVNWIPHSVNTSFNWIPHFPNTFWTKFFFSRIHDIIPHCILPLYFPTSLTCDCCSSRWYFDCEGGRAQPICSSGPLEQGREAPPLKLDHQGGKPPKTRLANFGLHPKKCWAQIHYFHWTLI